MQVLYDLNVILDVLLDRQPHSATSGQVLALTEQGVVQGHICACSVDTLGYLLTKELDRKTSRVHLKTVLKLLDVAEVSRAVIDSAIELDWPDSEDAIVHESARFAGIPAIVTRDRQGFSSATLRIYDPAEMLAILRAPAQIAAARLVTV